MLPGMQSNPCGTTWFARTREEDALPIGPPPDLTLEAPSETASDSVHLSGPTADDSPPFPSPAIFSTSAKPSKFTGREPFTPFTNPGQRLIDVARKLEGTDTYKLVGQLRGLRGTSDGNKMCADWVTSMLGKFADFKGHQVNVDQMQAALARQGWKRIPASQARPGDVAITNNGNHTELVATNGGKRLIGSNNNGHTYQTIHEHDQDPSQAIYWGRR